MSPTTLKRRLTTLDAGFLYGERPDQPMHVGGCMVYEGHITGDELSRIILERLHLLPRYRQKVVFPPFGLAHPTWEDDPEFDIRHHVEELTLPPPGDDRVLSEFGGQVYAPMLDRGRPLWKLIVLHGRPDGNTAIIWKIHHALVDGISSVDMTMTLHDLTPDAPPPAPPTTPWQPEPGRDWLTLLQDAVRDQLVEAADAWAEEAFRTFRPTEVDRQVRQLTAALASSMPAALIPAPPTPFNGPLSAQRQFAWAELPFAEVRTVKSALGGTVNDLVLAVLSGALGRYLRHHGFRTDGVELRAMCPVSMRGPDQRGALGNLVSIMIAPLPVGISDPVERLATVRRAMDRLKEQDQAGGLYALSRLADRIPAAWQALAGQLAVPTNTLLNTVSTNVPGPQIPLYLAGHKLLAMYPLGIVSANMGLFVAIYSYHQTLTFGLLVDPTLVKDVWYLADCLRESYAELKTAAQHAQPARFVGVTAADVPSRRDANARGRGVVTAA
jgi:diacylglycerol O-acyltransferase / wax synthase